MSTPRPYRTQRQPIDLALQGGGAHGPFTWGVPDRRLELIDAEGRPGYHYREATFQRVEALPHRIGGGGLLAELGASSKTDTRWSFLVRLHGLGHEAVERWLHALGSDLGRRSTVYLGREFLE